MDEFAGGLALEVNQLRHQLDAAEKARSAESRRVRDLQAELAGLEERPSTGDLEKARREAELWKQQYQALAHQHMTLRQWLAKLPWSPMGAEGIEEWDQADLDRKALSTQAYYSTLAAFVTCPPTLSAEPQPEQIAEFYQGAGLTGVVERVWKEDEGINLCTGWATTRALPDIHVLVSLFDNEGCIGYGQPHQPREDVAAALQECNPHCGFRITLTRPPKGALRVFMHVLQRGKPPFALKLPFLSTVR